jgi:hypothetical protein
MKQAVCFFAIAALLSLSACSADVAQWSEEVQLHDGKVITLQRRSTRGSRLVPGQHRALVKSWELCYPPMSVYWKSNEPFQPNHFDIANGEAFVKVPMRGCGSCKVTGAPKDGTLYFVLRNARWQAISAEQYPDKRWKNLIQTNIWNARRKDGDISGHWSLATKWQRDDITEDSPYGKVVKRDQLNACNKCNYDIISTDLKPIIESVPTDSFCK